MTTVPTTSLRAKSVRQAALRAGTCTFPGDGKGAGARVRPYTRAHAGVVCASAIANDELEYDPDTAVVSSQESSHAPAPPAPDLSTSSGGGNINCEQRARARVRSKPVANSKACTGQQGGGAGGEALALLQIQRYQLPTMQNKFLFIFKNNYRYGEKSPVFVCLFLFCEY